MYSQVTRQVSAGQIELTIVADQDPAIALALLTPSDVPLSQIRWTWRSASGAIIDSWTPSQAEIDSALADLEDWIDSQLNPVGVRYA